MQQDWVGRNVFELIHPDDLSYAMSLLREVLSASYVTINGEVRLRHRNGAYRWVDATAKNMLNEPGTQAIVANFRDITERKRADDTLRQFTERLKTLHAIDQAILKMQSAESIAEFGVNTLRQQLAVFQVSITLFDFATRQETVLAASSQGNTAGARDVQFPLTPFSTKSIDILRKGQTQLIEDVSRLPHKPPPNHPLQAEGLRPFIRIPLIDQGKLIGSLNLGADIPNGFSPAQIEVAVEVADQMAIAIQQASLRAQLQQHADELEVRVTQRTQELQQTKDRIEAILNSSGDAIILTDADGLIQQVNPAFDRLLAYKDSEIVGKSIELLMAPPSLHVLQEAINAVVTERRLARLEVVGLRKDSTFFNGDLALAPIVEGNDTRSIVCSLRDITERKQMEDDLRRTLADERELNELKTRFVSMVSHDFRTPLTIIRSSADILQRYQAQLDEERKSKQFEKIYGQIERMTALLNDVIAVNQADAGKTPFHPVKLKLDPFCREIVEETQALPTISHTLVYTYTGDGSDVMVDEKLLHQAISNLLSNAIKYSPEGRSIYFDVLDEDDAAVMRIRDSGIGIPEADFAHLFESFHRAGNVGEVEGSGLGLAIVKRAIDAHSGSVTVESQVGVGTTFTITLPRH
jgi:PAS domain S-box-containing protein